tara:strand:+ start:291 stop:443 length:153 start_codon:yes stop_codon:yes gene_type:complete
LEAVALVVVLVAVRQAEQTVKVKQVFQEAEVVTQDHVHIQEQEVAEAEPL